MNKLRVLHTEWSVGWGGQEIRIISEMESLRDQGFDMSIAADPEASIFQEATKRGFQAHPITFDSPANPFTIFKVASLAKTIGADLIHTHSSKDSWIGGFAGKIAGIPVVRSRHISALIKKKPTNRILYDLLPKAIITSGTIIAQQLIEATSVPKEKVFPVAPGADPNRFKPNPEHRKAVRTEYGIPLDATVFGMVAVLRSWKGHCLFLEAIHPVMKSDDSIWVLIVGDGPIKDVIEAKIAELGLKNRVIMTGHRSDPERFFPALDVHLLPSLKNEGAPQAVPQAMMCGVANITSDGGGLPEVLDHEITGLIAKAGDKDSLHQCIKTLAENPDLRGQLATTGQKKALESFTFERQVERTKAAYEFALTKT